MLCFSYPIRERRLPMKRFWLCAFILLLLLLGACQSGDAPLLTVKSGDSTITPYKHITSIKSWDAGKKEWTRAECVALDLIGEKEHFPTLIYSEDLHFNYRKDVTPHSITVYDTSCSELARLQTPEELSTMPAGELFVVVDARHQGKYIREEQDYERSGYDLCFRLLKNAVPNDDPLCQITCGDTTITPYENSINSFGGRVYADSPSLRATLQKGEELPLPTLTWTETAALSLNPNVQKREVDVYDVRNYRHLHDFSDISKLDTLPAGEYLVTVNLVLYHEYLPDIDKFTYTGYEMGFRLIKP